MNPTDDQTRTDERSWANPSTTSSQQPVDDTGRPEADRPADGGTPARGGGLGRSPFLIAGLLALLLIVVVGGRAIDLWPKLSNPFASQETDRSQPPLLKSIQDLSRYVAAEGTFQVVIDLERNRAYVPDFLLNERTLLVGSGNVEAYVDFGGIAEGAVTESADGKSVEIKLPQPQLGDPSLDLEASYVFAEERGLINRLGDVFGGDPNRQRDAYRLAEERIGTAARDSGLADRARENTIKMLTGLLRSLGYEDVKINWAPAT